jgi:hypothetical protein
VRQAITYLFAAPVRTTASAAVGRKRSA